MYHSLRKRKYLVILGKTTKMANSEVEINQTEDGKTEIVVRLEEVAVWLNLGAIGVSLFILHHFWLSI